MCLLIQLLSCFLATIKEFMGINTNEKYTQHTYNQHKDCQQITPTGRKILFFNCLLDGERFKVAASFALSIFKYSKF